MKPWLLLPAKLAHDLAPIGLQIIAAFRETPPYVWRPFVWRGLKFSNRLGLAGGFDKNGSYIEEWWSMGAGFIEIGTVTPEPQGPNPGRIIGRDIGSLALWNRMGFPGLGLAQVRANLVDLPVERPTPLLVNIGKNRTTPNERAAADYVRCIEELGALADAYVINISSPNTTGLRDLFKAENFEPFLLAILQARERSAPRTPALLKLSPDLEETDLQTVVKSAARLGIDGFIATNTTLQRGPTSPFPPEGGVSGAPLAELSKKTLRRIVELLGAEREDKLVISVGGVMTPEDVEERLRLGADLVQVYSALVFHGPWFFSQVAHAQSTAPSHD